MRGGEECKQEENGGLNNGGGFNRVIKKGGTGGRITGYMRQKFKKLKKEK